MVATKENGIQPVIVVDGEGTPLPIAGVKPAAVETTSQLLSAAALSFTDTVAAAKIAGFLALHLSGALPGDQTFTVTYDSADGAAFDTVILNETLTTGTQDKFFAFPPGITFRAGDHLRVALTNTGAPAITANLTVNYDP